MITPNRELHLSVRIPVVMAVVLQTSPGVRQPEVDQAVHQYQRRETRHLKFDQLLI
jgi:hypothetical protein